LPDYLASAVSHPNSRPRFFPIIRVILRGERADGSNREQRRDHEEGFGSHSTEQLSNDAASDALRIIGQKSACFSPESALLSSGMVAAARPPCPFFEAYWPK
jgi:hypothetical protein